MKFNHRNKQLNNTILLWNKLMLKKFWTKIFNCMYYLRSRVNCRQRKFRSSFSRMNKLNWRRSWLIHRLNAQKKLWSINFSCWFNQDHLLLCNILTIFKFYQGQSKTFKIHSTCPNSKFYLYQRTNFIMQ